MFWPLMGHSDIGVLRQYLKLSAADLQRAHQAAGPVDRMLSGKLSFRSVSDHRAGHAAKDCDRRRKPYRPFYTMPQ